MTAPPDFLYWYRAHVDRVVDADTVDMTLDLGFRLGWKQRFRLYGINAYELNSKDPVVRQKAIDGRDFVASVIAAQDVVVRTHMDKADKYGRWLAVIHYEADGVWVNLNDLLLERGLAVYYTP